MGVPPPAPVLSPPVAAWVSLGAGVVCALFFLAPVALGVFGMAAGVVAVVAWTQSRGWWQSNVGALLGVVGGGLMLLVVVT